MGVIGNIIGASGAIREAGEAVGGVAEVFVGNAAARDAAAVDVLALLRDPDRPTDDRAGEG